MTVRVQMAWRRRVMKGLVVMGPQREDGTGAEKREERSREEMMREMVRLQRRRWLAVKVQAVWRGRCGRRQAVCRRLAGRVQAAWWDRARRRLQELGRRRAAEAVQKRWKGRRVLRMVGVGGRRVGRGWAVEQMKRDGGTVPWDEVVLRGLKVWEEQR